MRYREVVMKDYLCDRCGKSVGNLDGWPYVEDGNDNYCPNCALIKGLIDVDEYMRLEHQEDKGINYDHAVYDPENLTVTEYVKWGRGFHKYIINLEES